MKTMYYSMIIVLIAIPSCIGISFEQYPEHMPHTMISLYTDKQNYVYNDTITIAGDIDKNDFKSMTWLDIEIRDPAGNIFKNDTIPINNTGHYTYKLKVLQNFTSGQYLVRVWNPYYNQADLGNSFHVNMGNQIIPKNDLGDGNVFYMQASDLGLPGDVIEIKGNLVTKDSIKIILKDPSGITKYSTTTFADRNGEFTSQLKIPSDAVSGVWRIIGNSGIYDRELNFTVSGYSSLQTCYGCHIPSTNVTSPIVHGSNTIVLQSPLKQFKSGVALKDITCASNLQLIIKAKSRSPACVKPDDVSKLVKRGWADKPNSLQEQLDFANSCIGLTDACRHYYNAKNSDPFGITALIIYHPPDVCLSAPSHSIPSGLHSCPPNKFYLKINSNSTAYLMGYNICDGNSCAMNNTLSLILPLNSDLNPDYQMIGLPVHLPWKYGDTVGIQLYVSPTNDNKTASLVDLGNSSIVP